MLIFEDTIFEDTQDTDLDESADMAYRDGNRDANSCPMSLSVAYFAVCAACYDPFMCLARCISGGLARFSWPALRPNGVLQSQILRRLLHPFVPAVGSPSLDAYSHSVSFFRGLRGVDTSRPVHGPFHRPRR